ncbi:MAG: hypothetical protein H7Z42_21870, partial [Roseiflexaceae bacterium]|nr:hypothetical protein [Roseiflexaceae bacterium]
VRSGLLGDTAAATTALSEAVRLRVEQGDTAGADLARHNLRHFGLIAAPVGPTAGRRRSQPGGPRLAIVALAALIVALLVGLIWNTLGGANAGGAALASATPLAIVAAPTAAASPEAATSTAPTQQPSSTQQSSSTPQAVRQPTPASGATASPLCRVDAVQLNLRAGPGTDYPVVGVLANGAAPRPIGRSADGQWISVEGVAFGAGWLSADPSLVTCNLAVDSLPQIDTPTSLVPTRQPTAPPTVRPTLRPTEPPALPTAAPPTEAPSATPAPQPSVTPSEEPQVPPSPAPIQPTPTPIPPSATPIPSIATPEPTATPIPPTATPEPTATPIPPTSTVSTPTPTEESPFLPPTFLTATPTLLALNL